MAPDGPLPGDVLSNHQPIRPSVLADRILIEPAKEGETMSDTVPCEAPDLSARIIAGQAHHDKTPAPAFTSSTPVLHDPARTRLRPLPAGSPTPAPRHPAARRWGISPLTLTPIQQAVWQVIQRELRLRPCCSLMDWEIAERCQLGRRTVQAALLELDRSGLIQRRPDHGRRSITRPGRLCLRNHPHRPTPWPPRRKRQGGQS